ncbi:hypothetical protein NQ318_020131 [Aromia moschata]|uniref:Major facilitator superfamily (MFS) profile domain-containing protein n=1 Tax=Aromia moschata TaxID=1265417 RepID=A0AAV8ZBA8_9CUCU|nr:hypothetical protein NQ318_020131 [Aromia moschata]
MVVDGKDYFNGHVRWTVGERIMAIMEKLKRIRLGLVLKNLDYEKKCRAEVPTISAGVEERQLDCEKTGRILGGICRRGNKNNTAETELGRAKPGTDAACFVCFRDSKKFTVKQKIALVMLGTADFMSFCSMSIMAPFYPKEAASKGMTESMAGFVFGYYALVVFLSSPIFGKVVSMAASDLQYDLLTTTLLFQLPRLGVKLLFITGLLISGICSLLFGTLHIIDDLTLFTTLSFVIRGIGALGASAYSTAAYVIIINIFPDHAGAVRGLIETFVGLGMSAGPGIGGILFAVSIIGGFGLPFYVVGFIIIVIAPLNIYLLPPAEKCEVGTKSGSLTNLLKLSPFHLSPGNIGLIFLLLSAMYGFCCPAWGWLTDRMRNYWWLMTTGLFCNSIILLFLGPSPVLSFLQDSILLNIISLSALGVFVAMALMPTYQFILDSSLQSGFVENLGTHSVIAGLWSSVYSLGEVLGPVLGGYLMEKYDFPHYHHHRKPLSSVLPVSGKEEEVRKEYFKDLSQLTTIGLEKTTKNGHLRIECLKTK